MTSRASTSRASRNTSSKALRDENAELLQFLYACPVGLVSLDADGGMSMLNPLAMQLVLPLVRGHEVTNLFKILEPYAPELRNMLMSFAPQQGTVCDAHRVFVGRDGGKDMDKVLSCTLVKLSHDRYVATLSDVSVQVAQERRLKQAEAWFSSLIDGVDDFAAISLDARGRIDHVNASVRRQTGFAEHELIGLGLEVFDAPDPASGVLSSREQVALATRDGWHLDEGWCARRDGSRQWCQRLISVCREEGDVEGRTICGFTVVLRLVTRKTADAASIRRRLTTDHLTGASNRAHFFEVAEREALRCHRDRVSAAVLMLDIDHFKDVNDTHGHAVGDEALKVISAACRGALRPQDTLARLGGEEFVVLLPSTDLAGAGEVAERLRAIIAGLGIATSSGVLMLTASFGCSIMDEGNGNVAAVLAGSDQALYAAKRAGRNRVAFPQGADIPEGADMAA